MYGSGIVRIGICDDEQTSIDCVRKCCENVCQKVTIQNHPYSKMKLG